MPTDHDPPDTHEDNNIEHDIDDEDLDTTGELAALGMADLDAELAAIDIHDPSRANKWVGGPEVLRRVDVPYDGHASA